ncbi:MAG: hypothetical protein COA69_13330 [Robiginitomaculum sp.]|nr:MAG: hypothetical protein COA69_13330 [Robiginitomaculum sp.]
MSLRSILKECFDEPFRDGRFDQFAAYILSSLGLNPKNNFGNVLRPMIVLGFILLLGVGILLQVCVETICLTIENSRYKMRSTSKMNKPPQRAFKIMYLLLPKDIQEPLVGDICEDYPDKVDQFKSTRWANAWVWKECLFVIVNVFLAWGIDKMIALKGKPKINSGD